MLLDLLMGPCLFFQCCKILLANQANPSEQDIDGFTAADLAEYNGHYDCARYLRAMEKNVSSPSHLQHILISTLSCFLSCVCPAVYFGAKIKA